MTTKPKELTQEEIDEINRKSHGNDLMSAPSYKLPSVKLHGNTGNYFRTTIKNGKMELNADGKSKLDDMGKTIRGTILRSRVQFSLNGPDEEIFTNEANKGGKFSVLIKTITEKGNPITVYNFTGTAEQIKARYEKIVYNQILYFILEDTQEIVRFKLHGNSLGPFFNYLHLFSKKEPIWMYVSEFGFKDNKDKFGIHKIIVPKRCEKVKDISVIQNAIDEVDAKIEEIEDYYTEKERLRIAEGDIPIEEAPEPQNDAQTGGEAPVADGTPTIPTKTGQGVDDGELNVKDIDFGGKNDGDPSDKELKAAGL